MIKQGELRIAIQKTMEVKSPTETGSLPPRWGIVDRTVVPPSYRHLCA